MCNIEMLCSVGIDKEHAKSILNCLENLSDEEKELTYIFFFFPKIPLPSIPIDELSIYHDRYGDLIPFNRYKITFKPI